MSLVPLLSIFSTCRRRTRCTQSWRRTRCGPWRSSTLTSTTGFMFPGLCPGTGCWAPSRWVLLLLPCCHSLGPISLLIKLLLPLAANWACGSNLGDVTVVWGNIMLLPQWNITCRVWWLFLSSYCNAKTDVSQWNLRRWQWPPETAESMQGSVWSGSETVPYVWKATCLFPHLFPFVLLCVNLPV